MNFTSKELNKTYILLQAAFQKFLVEDILKFLPSAIKNTPKGELMEGIIQIIIVRCSRLRILWPAYRCNLFAPYFCCDYLGIFCSKAPIDFLKS
jgi:hypothetical protein